MRIGVRLPQYGGDWATLREVARRLDRRGVDALWVNDHLQSPGRIKREPTFEAFTTLAAVAQITTHARLGVAVASATYRPPQLAAKMATVLDVISGGRMILGLGTGSDRAEHAAFGFPMGTPAERTAGVRHALRVVRAMGASPDGADAEDVLRGAPNRPAAANPAGLPVWLAAHGPVLLRLAGREAYGIVSAWTDPETLAGRIAIANDAAEAAGRPPPAAALYTFCLIGESESELQGWLADEAAALDATPAAVLRWLRARGGIVGTPGEVREVLRAHAAAGAGEVILALPSRVPVAAFDALAEALAAAPPPAAPSTPVPDVSPRDNLVELLVQRHREAGAGARTAVEDDAGEWTYDALAAAAARAGGALTAAGVRRGDRVAIALRDGRPWMAGFLGAAWVGAVAVPVDPAGPADHLRSILDDCEPALTLAEPEVDTGGWRSAPAGLLDDGAERPLAAVHPDDLAYLVYSSGSTGRPKGAMHAHRDMRAGIETYARHVLGLRPQDRCHSAARLFTSLGFGNGFFRVLGSGATAVLSGTRPNPRGTLELVASRGVTVLTGVPTFWSQLAEFLARHPRPGALDSVRLAVASGDSLPAPVADRLEELTGLRILEGLGCSECSNVLISTRPGERGGGTLGRVVPGVEVELRDPDGRVTGDGEPGRLWIRSASNTSGYWRRSELTRDLVHGEWIRMGDVLVREGEVYRHVGRVDDLFKVDGRWVSPAEVEACLLGHPAVREAAVAGVPGTAGLMRVHAWIVPAGDAPAGLDAQLRRHVAHGLAPHMAPRSVTFLEALPRLPSGKLDRRSLRRDHGRSSA